MCQFFSAIATRDGRVLFCENDSHELIVERAGLSDGDLLLRTWVRVECVPGADRTFPKVRVDETSVPSWYADERVEWNDRVRQVALRVDPVRKAYDAAVDPAHTAYDASVATARKAYDAAVDPAWTAYHAAVDPAHTAYHASRATARKAYNASVASIDGYVPAKGGVL